MNEIINKKKGNKGDKTNKMARNMDQKQKSKKADDARFK